MNDNNARLTDLLNEEIIKMLLLLCISPSDVAVRLSGVPKSDSSSSKRGNSRWIMQKVLLDVVGACLCICLMVYEVPCAG